LMTPYQCFRLFLDNEVIDLIKDFSNEYAAQQGEAMNLSRDEVLVFLDIHYFSGYHVLPDKEMYWETQKDGGSPFIREAMTRDRFRAINKYLHVADNLNLETDNRFAKVAPYAELSKKKFKVYAPSKQNLSIDEAMVKYFGRHGCKQFLKGKPIRFGYKVWCCNQQTGYLVDFEFYQGKSTKTEKNVLGVGESVVYTLVNRLPGRGYHIYCDRFFTSVPLLTAMAAMNTAITGTVNSNRIGKCPVDNLTNAERGEMDYRLSDDNVLVTTWKDSKTVYMASSGSSIYPLSKVEKTQRFIQSYFIPF